MLREAAAAGTAARPAGRRVYERRPAGARSTWSSASSASGSPSRDCADGCLFDGFPRTRAAGRRRSTRCWPSTGMPLDLVLRSDVADGRCCSSGWPAAAAPTTTPRSIRERLAAVSMRSPSRWSTITAASGILREIDGTRHAGRSLRADHGRRSTRRSQRVELAASVETRWCDSSRTVSDA